MALRIPASMTMECKKALGTYVKPIHGRACTECAIGGREHHSFHLQLGVLSMIHIDQD